MNYLLCKTHLITTFFGIGLRILSAQTPDSQLMKPNYTQCAPACSFHGTSVLNRGFLLLH